MMFSLLASLAGLAAASPLPAGFRMPIPQVARRNVVPDLNSGAPHFVVYSDKWLQSGEPPAVSDLNGWTTFALCFWIPSSGQDMAGGWQELTADQRTEIKANYTAANVNLVVAAFGSTSTPTSAGDDPVTTADSLAAWVKEYDLDGVDIDYEDFNAMNDGTAVEWLVSFQTELRSQLGDDYIITHAPVAPWFTTNTTQYPDGNYLQVDQQVGSTIDWYNVQFYNQGTDEYTDCTTLLTDSAAPWSNASLFQIIDSGITADKLLIGKPADDDDATNGYMDPQTLKTCVAEAKAKNWNGGLMVWEWPDGNSSTWVETVWGSS